MFRRVVLEDWVHVFPLIGFVILFTIFLVVILRVSRMKKKNVDRMSSLPLDQEKYSDEHAKHP